MIKWIIFCILAGVNIHTMGQISEIKLQDRYARIYNDKQYSGKSVYLGSDKELAGFNSKYLVVIDGENARIYDENGVYTGHLIRLGTDKYVKNVTPTNILIVEGNMTRYYDYTGTYTGRYTSGK